MFVEQKNMIQEKHLLYVVKKKTSKVPKISIIEKIHSGFTIVKSATIHFDPLCTPPGCAATAT